MTTSNGARVAAAAVCVAIAPVVGCGSGDQFPSVSGVVTLDGEPVPNATVSFYPPKGRAASGVTDGRGRYRLNYSPTATGTAAGDYRVTVSTWRPSRPQQGVDAESLPETPETIPPRYSSREQTKLTAAVVPGANKIDFSLSSSTP
ncbi:MAG: carboxypeptidase-like regulatory domain-containing protein [Planctomycetota bacterium]